MTNKVLAAALFLTALACSAPRGAAAFSFDGSAQLAAAPAAAVPPAAAPVRAEPRPCKPFLLSVSVGGVSETVVLERACTAANEPVWGVTVEVRGRRTISVRVTSDDCPAAKTAFENRVKSMVVDGISQEDADFIVQKTGPELKRALAAPAAEHAAILAAAREALKAHLSRP